MTTTPPEASSAPPPEPPGPPGPSRPGRDDLRDLGRVRRSRSDRKVAGVCGGLARHLDVDPVVIRVVLAVLVIFGGAGLLLYAAGWLLLPDEESGRAVVDLDERSRSIVLLVVAVLASLALLGDSVGGWGPPWPVIAIALVVLAVVGTRTPRRHPLADVGAAPASATAPAPGPGPASYAPVPVPPRRRGPVLFWYAAALIALGGGVLGVVDLAGASVADSAYPALALGVSAAALLLGAFWGRPGGLIALGLVSAVATAGATAADRIDAGRIDATPTSAAAVAERYALSFGRIDLDLSDVADPEALDGRTIEVSIHVAGRIDVVVPDGVDVVVESRVEAGERRIFGERVDGGRETSTLTTEDRPGDADVPELTLDLEVGFGQIHLDREGDR